MTSEERREARYQRRKARRAKKKDLRQQGRSYGEVFSYANLYKSYRLCRLSVSWKASIQKYIAQAPVHVYRTWSQLMKGTFRSPGFYEFDLCERGKKRHIRSVTVGERVVQRCLCDNALVPLLNKTFIYDNGASTQNKGYYFGYNRLDRHLQWHFRNHGSDGYVLVFDFSKFFDNISHDVIRRILEKDISDIKVRKLAEYFMDCFGDVGMGLGSQISQTFALASANAMDHYIKEVLRIKCYGRYMDDGYLIHPSKEYLQKCLTGIRKICRELSITLNEKKTYITRLSHGFTFLKARTFLLPSGKIVRKIYHRSVTRARIKIKKLKCFLKEGRLTKDDIRCSVQSWIAYARGFNAAHAIWNMIRTVIKVYGKKDAEYFLRFSSSRKTDVHPQRIKKSQVRWLTRTALKAA